MLSKIPMNRFVNVDEVAALVCWLASEDCSFSTGGVFDISGGRATTSEKEERRAKIYPVVRAARHLWLHLPQLDEEPRRAAGPVRRPPGHRHLQHLSRAHAVQLALPRRSPSTSRRGVLEAGGFPLEFPVMSLGETLLRPTAMLYRNLASMDVEESIRGNPLDGVVLLFGCDKTTPALLMGAASVDLPTIGVSGGPMLSGKYRGTEHRLGHQRLVDVGGPARRQDHPRRVPRGRVVHAPLARPLHDDGHRLDHGLDGRGARRRACRATPRSRRSTRAATCWRARPAGASSRW